VIIHFRLPRCFCHALAAVGMIFSSVSCAWFAKPAAKPFEPPALSVTLNHFVASPLSGPTNQSLGVVLPKDALSLKLTLIALERMPAGVGQSLGAMAGVVAETRGGAPIMSTGRLTGAARWMDLPGNEALAAAFADQAGRQAVICSVAGALAPGVTAVLRACEPMRMLDPVTGLSAQRILEVYVYRPPLDAKSPHLQVTLCLQDSYVPPRPIEPDEAAASTTQPAARRALPPPLPAILVREMAVVPWVAAAASGSAAVVLPFRMSSSDGQAIAAVIAITPGDDSADHQDAVNLMLSDVALSAADADRLKLPTPAIAQDSAINTALASLYIGQRRRSTLVFLSDITKAPLCAEVAMVADDAVLERLVDQISRQASDWAPGQSALAVGWLLDSTAFQMLGQMLANNDKVKMPRELMGVLSAYAGEAGRHSSSIEEVSKGLASRPDLEARILAENLIYLEDSSPSSRIRACDWLKQRNLCPAGYEPLNDEKQRRMALDKAASAVPPALPTGAKP